MVLKVAQITTVHSANDVRIFHKECKSLANAGYDVDLAAPNATDECVGNVRIVSIKKHSARWLRFFSGSLQAFKIAMKNNARVCHFHDPELIPTGVLLALMGKKVIYDVHEDVPRQILSKEWIPHCLRLPLSKCVEFVEWVASRFFYTAIVAATDTIAVRFPREKTITVQNFPMLDEQAVTSNLPYTKRQNNVAYIGGITRNRGALENIKAFDYIKHSDARLLLAGTFMDDGLESQCRALDSWEYVDYQGFISREGVWALLENTRVGLVVLHPLDNYIDALPIKLFEYMAAGVPVIASDFPLWRRIVSQADCGLLVNPLVPEEIGEAIDWLLDNPESAERMGQNGKNAVRMKYNWSQEEQKLLSLYETFPTHSV